MLSTLGAKIELAGAPGEDLPFELTANGLAGGEIELEAGRSSQYLTGLLLAAPLMRELLRVRSLVSSPYIDMTIGLMNQFDVDVGADGAVAVRPGAYRATALDIEPDASTASYFFTAAALTGRTP